MISDLLRVCRYESFREIRPTIEIQIHREKCDVLDDIQTAEAVIEFDSVYDAYVVFQENIGRM